MIQVQSMFRGQSSMVLFMAMIFLCCIIYAPLPCAAYQVNLFRPNLLHVNSIFRIYLCNDQDIKPNSVCCDVRNDTFFHVFSVNKLLPHVTPEELSNENLVHIVNLESTDQQCNDLVWKCLGYVYNNDTGMYDNTNVFPKWRDQYPQPVDVIGVTRNYDPEVDKPVRGASMRLMRSIPPSFKGGVVRSLRDFRGFKLSELTPNKTRRAQLVNWLLYYREELYGKSLADLATRRAKSNNIIVVQATSEEDMKPSEKQFENHRLDMGS